MSANPQTRWRPALLLLASLVSGWWIVACGDSGAPAESTTTQSSTPEEASAQTAAADDLRRRRAQPELMQSLRQAAAAPRHPADGGGRAWLLDGDSPPGPPVAAGQAGSWTLVYEAGPLGIQSGGRLFFQVSPFWGWSTPQVTAPDRVGYTEVSTTASGVRLRASTLDQQLLGIEIEGRDLRPGEQVRVVYGAGAAGAIADRFAERRSRFWFAVDADGDGVRKVLVDSPGVDVAPGAAARLLLFLPSSARPGDPVRLSVAVVDRRGNAGIEVSGQLELTVLDDVEDGSSEATQEPNQGLVKLPLSFDLAALSAGPVAGTWEIDLDLVPEVAGVLRLSGRLTTERSQVLQAESNPLQVSSRGGRILWGDLQNHSGVSDGTGVPEDLFDYARSVAALDVFSLTDHDHWGMLFYDAHPEFWQETIALNERFNQPGRFVAIVGFEWTHWTFGHRHVLDFAPPYELLSSIDPRYDTPQKLWGALADQGGPAITLAHHSAGGPVATDWSIAPDPRFEPVTEVVSVHGSSEAADSPGLIYQPVVGNFVRDALDSGYPLGLLGSSDGHDGHPGLAHLDSGQGGLAAILSPDLTRRGVYDALMARRVYATNGPRIILRATFGGFPMGAAVPLDSSPFDGSQEPPINGIPANTLVVRVIAPAALERLEVIRSGEVFGRLDCAARRTCSLALPMDDLRPKEYLYVRAVQQDGGAAWSSPFFFTASATASTTASTTQSIP